MIGKNFFGRFARGAFVNRMVLACLAVSAALCAGDAAARPNVKPPTDEEFLAKGGTRRAAEFVNVRQGTFFFAMTVLEDAAEVKAVGDYRTILALSTTAGGMWARYLTFGCMNGKVLLEIGSRDLSAHLVRCGGDWKKGRTYKVAIVYDDVTGVKVLRDGSVVGSNWGKDSWQTSHVCLDLLHLAGAQHEEAGGRFATVGNVKIFRRALDDKEIQSLFDDKPVPVTVPGQPESEERRRTVVAHGSETLGLPDDSLPELRPGRSLAIADVPALDIQYIKKKVRLVMDGDHNTMYPGYGQKLYSAKGPFRIALDKPESFQFLTLQGGFKGTVYAGGELRETPDPQRKLADVDSRRFTWRHRFPEPVKSKFIHIVPDCFPGEIEGSNDNTRDLTLGLWDQRSKLTEMRMQSIRDEEFPAQADQGSAERRMMFLQPPTKIGAGVPVEIGEFITAHFAPRDASCAIASDSSGQGGEIQLEAMQSLQLIIPPQGIDQHLDTIMLDLVLKAEGDGAMRLAIRDPEMPRIEWFESVCRYVPATAATWERARLVADPIDTVVPAGKVVWLTFTTERPVVLRLGGAEGTRVVLGLGDRAKVLAQYRVRMGDLLRERFSYLSEPRPWGKVKTQTDEEQFNGVGAYSWTLLGELYRALRTYRGLVPGDEFFEQMNVWTHPQMPSPNVRLELPPESRMAPKWAALQRECLKSYDEFVQWWIKERQIENGEFGGNPGDDTDLVNDWASLYFMTGDETVRESLRRIADLVWAHDMKDGLNLRFTDTLHAYEEGTNANSVAALAFAGQPLWHERAMLMTLAIDKFLLIPAADGHRHIIASWYGRNDLFPGKDGTINALMFHPANYLMCYSGHPRATQLCKEWFDAWYAHGDGALLSAKEGHEIDAKTGQPLVGGRVAIAGYGFPSLLYRLADATRDKRVLQVLRANGLLLDGGAINAFASHGLDFIQELLDMRCHPGVVNLAQESAALTHFQTNNMADPSYKWAYAGWLATGNQTWVEDALERLAKRLKGMMLMHTVADQSVDRVALPKDILDLMILGGVAHARNQWPMKHAASWSGLGVDAAIWVKVATERSFRASLYNFKDTPQEGCVRFWRLLPGRYRIRLGPDMDGDGAIDVVRQECELDIVKLTPFRFMLPPQQPWVMEVGRISPEDETGWKRADLAICDEDVALDPASGELSIRVHNIGVVPAENFEVVVMARENVLWRGAVPRLDAPLDLEPRTVVLKAKMPEKIAGRELVVTVDPGNKIPEICEENNVVKFKGK